MGSIDLGPVRPHWVKFGPDGMLYVSAELDKAMDVLDPRLQKKVGSIPTGQPESHMVVMSHDGRRAYTANVGAGTVSVAGPGARKADQGDSRRRDSAAHLDVAGWTLGVHLPTRSVPGWPMIDTATNEVSGWIALPAVGYGTAPTPGWQVAAGDYADRESGGRGGPGADEGGPYRFRSPRTRCRFWSRPDAVLTSPARGDGKVAVLNLEDWKVEKQIETGPGADGLAWVGKKALNRRRREFRKVCELRRIFATFAVL